jgi:hypothetical protein
MNLFLTNGITCAKKGYLVTHGFMMAALFLLYLVSLVLIFCSKRKAAMIVVIINIALCMLMLLHHATDVLNIRL